MTLIEKPFQDLNGTMYDVELSFFDSEGDLLEVKKIMKIEPGRKSEKLDSPKRADFIRMQWTMAPIKKQNEYLLDIPLYSLCGKVYLDGSGITDVEIENNTQVDRY